MKQLKDLIITPYIKDYDFMKHHIPGVGKGVPSFFHYLSDEKNNPDGKLFVAYRRLENVQDAKPHVSLHKHTVDQAYVWIGNEPDLSGLTVEVFLGDEKFLVTSPRLVYIPAGVPHAHRYVSGSGHFLGILLTGGKSYNEVTI